MKKRQPFSEPGIFIGLILLMMALLFWQAQAGWKPRSYFDNITGEIMYIDSTASAKYIEINKGSLKFRVNKTAKLNNTGKLRLGDTITIYYSPHTPRGNSVSNDRTAFLWTGAGKRSM